MTDNNSGKSMVISEVAFKTFIGSTKGVTAQKAATVFEQTMDKSIHTVTKTP